MRCEHWEVPGTWGQFSHTYLYGGSSEAPGWKDTFWMELAKGCCRAGLACPRASLPELR